MQLQAISIAAWDLSRDLRHYVAAIPRRLFVPEPRRLKRERMEAPRPCRATQEPWRLCAPPGVPDALPFAYRYEEPGTVDAIGPRVP